MKLILLNLIVLYLICNVKGLLFERSKRFKYDDGGKIRAHCEKYCEDPVENFTSTVPGSPVQKIPLVDREKQATCGKYKGIQDCVDKLNEVWVHNTMKSRLSVCKPRLNNDEKKMEQCHKNSAALGLAMVIGGKTPNRIWKVREKIGEDTLEYIQ